MKKLLLPLVLLPLLGACQTGGGPAPVSSSPPPASVTAQGFQCPASGTRVTFDSGVRFTFNGADAADPTVCLVTTTAGGPQRWLLNFYLLPLTDERSVRLGFAGLWPLEPGLSAAFTFIGPTVGNEASQYAERWRVERAERLRIAGEARDTLVVTQTREGMNGNDFLGTNTFWFDTASRTWIKRTVATTRGVSAQRNFEATRITVP